MQRLLESEFRSLDAMALHVLPPMEESQNQGTSRKQLKYLRNSRSKVIKGFKDYKKCFVVNKR